MTCSDGGKIVAPVALATRINRFPRRRGSTGFPRRQAPMKTRPRAKITRDRCYDFQNIFAEKFSESIGVSLLKLLLVYEKMDHNIGF
jgi:hypothetical protein